MESRKHHRDFLNHNKRHSKKKFLKVGCFRSSPKPNRTTREVLREFADNTTLLGISHAIRNKSICWLVAYTVCLVLSIVQTWSTAAEFFEKKSHQSYGVESRMLMPFPSITICNNIMLPLTFVNNGSVPNYNNTSLNDLHDVYNVSEDEIEKFESKNQQAVMNYVRKLDPDLRTKYAVPIDDWLVKCIYQYHDCNMSDSTLFYKFNHPIGGSCLTFNPAFSSSGGTEVDIDTKLMLTMRRQGIGYQIFSGRPRVCVLIHSPGTSPLMDLPEAIEIYGGQNVAIGLRLIQKNFMLKHKDPPTCVSKGRTGMNHRKKNLYFTENTPYLYSIEACMKTCIQEKINTPCNKLDASFPILENKELESMRLYYPPIQACNTTKDLDLSMDNCECPFPCEIYQYSQSIDTTDLVDGTSNNHQEAHDTADNESDNKVERMKVSIQFLSNIFDHLQEELDYNLTQFMGILGGNMSLWLGLCVLSLLELVELAWNLISIQVRNYFGKSKNQLGQPPNNDAVKNTKIIPKFRNPYFDNYANFKPKQYGTMGFTRNPFRNMKLPVDDSVSVINRFRSKY